MPRNGEDRSGPGSSYAHPPQGEKLPRDVRLLLEQIMKAEQQHEQTRDPHILDGIAPTWRRLLDRAASTRLPNELRRALLMGGGRFLLDRFQAWGETDDLAQALRAFERAVEQAPQASPERAHHLADLARALRTRFGRFDDPDDLDRAARALGEALQLSLR
jgi:tetratricopeptide (TPR) repeat protein